MTETSGNSEDWATTWIEKQRERLQGSVAGDAESRDDSDRRSPWGSFGSEWFAALEKLLRSGFEISGVPLGWAREHEQDWRDLAVAQAEYRKLESELLGKLFAVQTAALDRLERAVRERAAEARPFKEIRELYDRWIECGEEAYAEMARSDEYCRLQAAVGNAGIRLRAQQQRIVERGLKQLDLPTRAELNSVHRELRELRERLGGDTEGRARSTGRSKSANRPTRTSGSRTRKRKRT
jgi:hypothetical protein